MRIVALLLLLSGCITYKLEPAKFAYMACVTVTDGEHKGMIGRIAARLPPTRYRIFNDVEVAEVEEIYIVPFITPGDVCEVQK